MTFSRPCPEIWHFVLFRVIFFVVLHHWATHGIYDDTIGWPTTVTIGWPIAVHHWVTQHTTVLWPYTIGWYATYSTPLGDPWVCVHHWVTHTYTTVLWERAVRRTPLHGARLCAPYTIGWRAIGWPVTGTLHHWVYATVMLRLCTPYTTHGYATEKCRTERYATYTTVRVMHTVPRIQVHRVIHGYATV